MSDVVLSERRGPVALLTLNRPDRLNAWTGELGERYYELLDECAADPDVRVIVVTGAGRGFCAGADMDDLQGIGGAARDETLSAARPSRPVYHATTLPKIVIAAINGACAGLGFVHALMCDVRFAAAGAKFTSAFSRRGLIAEWGSSWVLPRLVGPARAIDIGASPFRLEPVSATFHGRDLFAPVAAHIALGARLDEAGSKSKSRSQ